MSDVHGELADALSAALRQHMGGDGAVSGLRQLSGGANQETWSFDFGDRPLILRRAPGGQDDVSGSPMHITLDIETVLVRRAAEEGVPVPAVQYVLQPPDRLGSGYVMERIEGETIPQKILKDDRFAAVRGKLARRCGEILAKIHQIPVDFHDKLDRMPARPQLKYYWDLYEAYDSPRPVFELAFRWLTDHAPEHETLTLVHGDFRHGNLLIDEQDLRAVLDWELAHIGDPLEDLGWICVNSWRFGRIDRRVGGFGDIEDLLDGYHAAGGAKVTPADVRYWEVFGTLKWGMMCMSMYEVYRTGVDPSVERAAIGRRASETEVDLMRLLTRENT
jgi:aminoglycoside phosphotransferase (APT) family kinase protein